jgi:CheY-like chemotaxis protein/PAS domain-containing protein
MPEKPRVLVIEREGRSDPDARRGLEDCYDVVVIRTMARALVLLRQQQFDGVFVDISQLQAVRWAGLLIQADEILDAIADGVAVVDPSTQILWTNPEFQKLMAPGSDPAGLAFYAALGSPERIDPGPDPFAASLSSREPASAVLRLDTSRYLRLTVTPVFDPHGAPSQLIALTRDITAEVLQEQKISAIHKAGEELADLTPEELAEMGVQERTDLLKFNITRHMKDLLGLDYVEIRMLDRETGRLLPLLEMGMTHLAASRELFARKEGNGVTGYVAATGQSYLCVDSSNDPLYLEGAPGARSSLTVPLLYHGEVIGTLNVENLQPNAFDVRDRQFLEIYARNVAAALNTLELLQAEKQVATTASVEAISRELALPIDDILNDATIALDRYAGHDEDIVARLRHLLFRAREIRSLVQKVGSSIAPDRRAAGHGPPPPLAGTRLLVADAEEAIRRAAHNVLGQQGAIVETARDAHEAVALARQTPYSAALTDIRLPDLNGYEVYRRLREVQPGMPVILMTGFGYDPTHSIVKARQEGLQSVLYKPFRSDRLIEAVEQVLRTPPHPPAADGNEVRPDPSPSG